MNQTKAVIVKIVCCQLASIFKSAEMTLLMKSTIILINDRVREERGLGVSCNGAVQYTLKLVIKEAKERHLNDYQCPKSTVFFPISTNNPFPFTIDTTLSPNLRPHRMPKKPAP